MNDLTMLVSSIKDNIITNRIAYSYELPYIKNACAYFFNMSDSELRVLNYKIDKINKKSLPITDAKVETTLKFKPGTLFRHFDGQGTEHHGVVLSNVNGYIRAVFLSTNPNWSISVEMPRNFNEFFQNYIFGKVLNRQQRKTYLCFKSKLSTHHMTEVVDASLMPNYVFDFISNTFDCERFP